MIRSAFVTIKDMDKKALERNILLSTFVFTLLNHNGYHCMPLDVEYLTVRIIQRGSHKK